MTRDPLTGTALPMAPAAGRVHLLEDDEDRTTERQGRRWTKPNDKQLVILQLLAKADEGLRGREIIERSNGLFDQTSLHSATVRLRSEKLIASKGKTNGITWFILPAGLKALEQAESDDAKPAPVKQRAPKVTIKADVVPAPAAPPETAPGRFHITDQALAIEAITKAGGFASIDTIAALANTTTEDIGRALSRLKTSGELVNVRFGVWALPGYEEAAIKSGMRWKTGPRNTPAASKPTSAPRPATDTFAAAISAEGDLLIFEAPPGRSAYEATPIVIQRAHARLLAQYLRRLPISHEFNV